MRKTTISVFIFITAFFSQLAMGQNIATTDTVSVFVYKDKDITTPLNALRAELTSSLINASNGSYFVLDRSEEILNALRKTFQYQESGLVRDDQLVAIGQQLGEKYLYVVSVVYYKEFDQYFFEGKFINIETSHNPKQALYPDIDKGQPEVKTLSPQNQIRAGRALAEALGLMSKEEIASRAATRAQEEKSRMEAIERQQRAAYKAQRNANLKDFLSPYYAGYMTLGGGRNGFQLGILFDIKYLSLGVGMNMSGDKYFPINKGADNINNGHFIAGDGHTEIGEASYYYTDYNVNFFAGLNFKYFNLGIRPELYSLHSDSYRYDDFIPGHYSHILLGLTPMLSFHIPFNEKALRYHDNQSLGLIGSIGYTFIPEVGYNPGFHFSLGLGVFW